MIKKNGEVRLPARASLWYVGSNMISKAVGMLLTPIFTRILTGAEYGGYTLYMSWLGLLSTVALGCVSQNVVYKGFQLYADRDKFAYSVLGAAGSVSFLVTAAISAVGILFGLPAVFIPLLLIQVLCDTAINVSAMKMRYSYSYKSIVISSSVQSLLVPIVSLALISVFDLGARGRIYGLLSVSLLLAAIMIFGMKRRGGRLYDREVWKYALGRSAGLFPHLLAGALISQADKLILSRVHGDAALAKYSVAHTVGMGLVFVVGGISSSLNPWIMRKLRAKDVAAVREIGWLLAKSISAAAMFIVAIAPEAIGFLAPSEYGEALPAVLPIALSTLPYFVTSFGTVGAIFSEHGGRCSVAALPAAAVNLALGMLLIPEFRYTGAALSMFFAHLTMAVGSYFTLKKCGLSEIIDVPRTVGIFALSAILGGLIALAYPSFSVRTLLLIPPALVLTGAAFDAKDRIMESGA